MSGPAFLWGKKIPRDVLTFDYGITFSPGHVVFQYQGLVKAMIRILYAGHVCEFILIVVFKDRVF